MQSLGMYLTFLLEQNVKCNEMVLCDFGRHLPALGESLATLVGAMPVAFLEPDLNAYNPLSVFNTKTPRERASLYPPD